MKLLHHLPACLGILACLASTASALTLPLSSTSRWIVDATGKRVKLRCVNWAGHLEANLPEGLNKQPLTKVADWIKTQGFNCVRLTYSTEMALNMHVTVEDSFRAAATSANVPLNDMLAAYTAASTHNPFLVAASGAPAVTRADVFAALIDALWTRGIMTVLDNHVSKAGWCCNLNDGNGWWASSQPYIEENSKHFQTDPWVDGLKVMAAWARGRPGVVGMALRNELRQIPFVQNANDWFPLMTRGADAVHAAFPEALVVIGGVNGGTDLTLLKIQKFDANAAWKHKRVWEWHAYSFTVNFPWILNCGVSKSEWGWFAGFVLEQGLEGITGPLWLSEFGVGMLGGANEGGINDEDYRYLKCLVEYQRDNDGDWAIWALQGSYYVREGKVDHDEGFGVLNHDWSDWRNPAFKNILSPIWGVTQGPI